MKGNKVKIRPIKININPLTVLYKISLIIQRKILLQAKDQALNLFPDIYRIVKKNIVEILPKTNNPI